MKTQDYTVNLRVDATAQEVFSSINAISKWWSTNSEGRSEKLNDMFTVHFGETYITSKVTEFVPGKKIVWLVMDCNKPWLKNTKEWVDTEMIWEISSNAKGTQLHFTHQGLVPAIECFGVCSNAWGDYLNGSLMNLIATGKGQPTDMKNKS